MTAKYKILTNPNEKTPKNPKKPKNLKCPNKMEINGNIKNAENARIF
jgi:hypothetical protein